MVETIQTKVKVARANAAGESMYSDGETFAMSRDIENAELSAGLDAVVYAADWAVRNDGIALLGELRIEPYGGSDAVDVEIGKQVGDGFGYSQRTSVEELEALRDTFE